MQMMNQTTSTTIRTHEDELVAEFIETIDELRNYADIPEMTAALGAYNVDPGEGELLSLDNVGNSEWGARVRDIKEWAEDAGFYVTHDVELHTDDLPYEGRVILYIAPNNNDAPIFVHLFCEVTGETELRLYPKPLADTDPDCIWSEPLDAFDIDAIRDRLTEYYPFVTGRVVELIEDAGVSQSRAHVVVLREAGLSHQQVADYLDQTKGGSASAQSKFNDTVVEAEHLFVARTGAPKRVLAKKHHDATGLEHAGMYVCETEAFDTARPISFITMMANDDVELGSRLSVETETFASLGDCIEAKYVERDFEHRVPCEEVYEVFEGLDEGRLVDAGYSPLPTPPEALSQ